MPSAPATPFTAGSLTSLRLVGPGLPVIDPTGAAGSLVSALSRQDFGVGGVAVRADGTLAARR
ncbi:MAG: hypothetical protein ACXVRN_02865 [Solirubrobacteraceae bacterium]